MKSILSCALCFGMLMAFVPFDANAQSSATPEAPLASAASSTKATKQANRALVKEVVRALTKTKGLQSNAITVRANNGAIILEGAVPEQAQMDLATRAAASVPGVTSVKSALTLSTF
ncbi:BON domain-containing protein (plasmid) [Burkholderia sp. KK1]|nr:BON domain-containing protein [Burkholderia sp. KK1]